MPSVAASFPRRALQPQTRKTTALTGYSAKRRGRLLTGATRPSRAAFTERVAGLHEYGPGASANGTSNSQRGFGGRPASVGPSDRARVPPGSRDTLLRVLHAGTLSERILARLPATNTAVVRCRKPGSIVGKELERIGEEGALT
jgi:hypothetical protein